jgi:CDP-diacylglycerol--glycerol-3-phosphate 3-phosphatidyltransferase
MTTKEIFTLSNFMSFVRVLLSVPIFYFISVHDNLYALAVIILAMITDWLDGFFARKWKQVTTLGKVIDPLADKMCTAAGFISLSLYHGLPFWITFVIVGRDIIIMLASLIMIGQRKLVMVSNMPGKMTVFFITLLGIVYLIQVEWLKTPLVIISAVFIVISIVNYAIGFFKNFSGAHEH